MDTTTLFSNLTSTASPLVEAKCRDILHNASYTNNTSICQATSIAEDCGFDDGFIQYVLIVYCIFANLQPLGITVMFLWLFIMLIGLATTADVFFGPCLIVMADTLHLSQNVAGVTLLALGNGAPDIFSAISAILTIKDGDAGLAFGALLGAGMFVTSVTAAAIALVKPFQSMSRPLLKDIVFYLLMIFWTFVIMYKGEITIYESVGFIIVYVVYVVITVGSRIFYTKAPEDQEPLDEGEVAVPTFRMRSGTDVEPNLTPIGHSNPSFDMKVERSEQNHDADSDAGYDTSLDFPGGLRRVETEQAADPEIKPPRSRRFEELDIGSSSPKVSRTQRPSRLDERMKRVSRVQRYEHKLSNSGDSTDGGAGGAAKGQGRKISTTSFTGVDRRANYLARWMMAYGNLENVEHRSRAPSVLSNGSNSRSRSNSRVADRKQSAVEKRKRADSEQRQKPLDEQIRMRSESVANAPTSVPANRRGFKISGGIGMGVPENYFNRKKSQQQQKQQQKQQEKEEQKRKQQEEEEEEERKQRGRRQRPSQPQTSNSLQVPGSSTAAPEPKRSLYRIESVDEQLDDDTLDRLNRINQQATAANQRAAEEEKEEQVKYDTIQPVADGKSAGKGSDKKDSKAEEKQKEEEPEEEEEGSAFKEFLFSLVPVDMEEFPEMAWYNKVYEIIKAPLLFLLLITTPLVDYDQPLNGWSRILNSIHCAVAPVFIATAFKGYQWMIADVVPVLAILAGIGLILGLVVFFTSSDFEPPRYHNAFSFFGFLTAIVWIYTFANEVVNVLESAGMMFQISNTILGLTVLAWANSIGDVISNTVLARQNFPRVAISACFGGPLFNLLLGIGVPFTLKLAGDGLTSMPITITEVELTLVTFVSLSLITSMIYLTITRFSVQRPYGIILIGLYLVFIVIAVLAEQRIIKFL